MEFKTRLGRTRRGVCSEYLCNLLPGDLVTCLVRRGSFPSPNPCDPLLLVGPGTGVAPMRSFLQERYGRYADRVGAPPLPPTTVSGSGSGVAPCMVCFGCRSSRDDFLYESEWNALVSSVTAETLLSPVSPTNKASSCQVLTAFSRDGPPCSKRCYVTPLIRDNSREVWEIMQQVESLQSFISSYSLHFLIVLADYILYLFDFRQRREYTSPDLQRLKCRQM